MSQENVWGSHLLMSNYTWKTFKIPANLEIIIASSILWNLLPLDRTQDNEYYY